MNALLLAAGLGTRLWPLTAFRPKALVPFLGRPLLDHALELVRRAGVKEVVINTHHLPQLIERFVGRAGSGRFPIHLSHEPRILGTAGALRAARDRLGGETFLVCNAKIYFEEDLKQAMAAHREREALATLLLSPWEEHAQEGFNPVWMDGRARITAFGPRGGDGARPFVFTGVQILEPRILDFIPPGPSEMVRHVYPRLIEGGEPVTGFLSRAFWCECSTPRRYLEGSLRVLERRGLENLIEGENQGRCQGVILPRSSRVDKGARLERSLLWEEVSVGPEASLADVIIAAGVQLPAGTRLEHSIITPMAAGLDLETVAPKRLSDDLLVWRL